MKTAFETLGERDANQVVASGTSCSEQIEDLGGKIISHPIELIDPDT